MIDRIEKAINEFTKDISDHYTLSVDDGSIRRRFTYYDHKIRALENELKKFYGDHVVGKICNKVKKAETDGKLKQKEIDDSAQFVVDIDKVKSYFTEDLTEDVDWKEMPKKDIKKRLNQAKDFREYLKNRMSNEGKDEKQRTKKLIENISRNVIQKAQKALNKVNEEELNELTAEVEQGKLNYQGDTNKPSAEYYKKRINSVYQLLKNSDDPKIQKLWKRIQASDKNPDFKPHPDGSTVMIMPDNSEEKYQVKTEKGKEQEITKL